MPSSLSFMCQYIIMSSLRPDIVCTQYDCKKLCILFVYRFQWSNLYTYCLYDMCPRLHNVRAKLSNQLFGV